VGSTMGIVMWLRLAATQMAPARSGVLDMAGNVLEWVADWYAVDFCSRSPDSNPMGPESGTKHIIRGGSWWSLWDGLRPARASKSLDYPSDMVGFSRELDGYGVLSPLAVAAHQLRAQGKTIRMGMRIRYLYVSCGLGVYAWDLPNPPDWKAIDRIQYRKLIIRAVHEILQPIGVTEAILKNWLIGQAGYLAPPGFLKTTNPTRLALPLLADLKYLRVGSLSLASLATVVDSVTYDTCTQN
jgi:hypothetical protein